MTPEEIAREVLEGAERMGVDLKSTLDISDECFAALTALAGGAAPDAAEEAV